MHPLLVSKPAQPIAKCLGGVCAGFCLSLLAACQTTPVAQPHTAAPPAATAPANPVAAAALPVLPPLATTGNHYVIRANLSDLRFLVYRAGPLANLGHNHVIQAKTISGGVYLTAGLAQSGFEMDVSLADLQIDVPEARAVEGVDFAVQPSAAAIEGTRKNMLGASELDAAKFPDIHIRSVSLVGPPWGPDLTVRIALHGVEREFTLPIAIDYSDNRLTVTGGFEIHQTDFGITPLSILGGGLQVADQVKVRFHIVAEKP